MNVGLRELKAKLSEYVTRVNAGEVVVVTDRGKPVAVLQSFAGANALARGYEEGWAEPPRRQELSPARPQRSDRTIQSVLDEDRG